MARWTEYELKMLNGWYEWCRDRGKLPALAELVGMSLSKVRRKASKIGIAGKPWTAPEISYQGKGLSALPSRILEKVGKTNHCWHWEGLRNNYGYGRVWINGNGRLVHVVLYEAVHGLVPDGLQLDHLCRNRACCNPEHLEPVTQQENSQRGDTGKHNSDKTHCPKGHEYSGENLKVNKRGGRECRMCCNARNRASYHRQADRC